MSCVFPGFLVIETNRYTDFPLRNISVLYKNLMKEPNGIYRRDSGKNVLLWQRHGTYRQNDDPKVLLKLSNGTYRCKGDKNVLL